MVKHGRPLVVLVLLALALQGCAAADGGVLLSERGRGVSATTTSPAPSPSPSPTDAERVAAVYAALLEAFVTKGSQGRPPRVITVGTAAEKGAGWGLARTPPEPISALTRDLITADLKDIVEVRWAAKPGIPDQGQWSVTLAPVPVSGERLEISVSALAGFDDGWLNTYVINGEHTGWAVTGTTTPVGLT